jgi:prevent-host-death family protein
MIKSLRESKAKLSELVERASRGEDVFITVRGKVKARLTRAGPDANDVEPSRWAAELKALHQRVATGRLTLPTDAILSEDRGDRL